MRAIRLVLSPVLVAISASVAAAQSVNVDYIHSTNFAQYKTFYDTTANQWNNPIQQQRAISMLDSTLKAKGWTKAPNAQSAQVLVVILVATQQQKSLTTMYSGGGWGGYRGGGFATTSEQTQTEGTMTVDMYDLKTKEQFWRATATAELSTKSEDNTKKIYNSFKKMFDKFPPPPDKKN